MARDELQIQHTTSCLNIVPMHARRGFQAPWGAGRVLLRYRRTNPAISEDDRVGRDNDIPSYGVTSHDIRGRSTT